MNYLLAEIKQRGKSDKTLKVFSEADEIYPFPNDLDNPKEYDSDYKLEDDEWFHIPNFKTTDYSIDILNKDFSSTEYNNISKLQQDKIKYLMAFQKHDNNTSYFFFQKVNSSQVLHKSWFKISDTPTLEKDSPIIIVNNYADAIYDINNDILYFKKLTSITTIFQGISELYKEATQEETEKFLDEKFINLEDNFQANNVGTANRKRIAMAVETLNSFSPTEKTTIFDYIKGYCANIPFDETAKTFTVSDEEKLKHLLWGIEQRYYTTKVGDEKRVANSVSTL
ncbi:hypothetical protein [Labilibacter marinus]|uniref:hypothetical protein n=1 Tax=Labilibacter marinus TaxID=1477105 RepID=UPI0009501A56|nr:hypothetical protein [Labilibacter marinus]